MMLLILLSVVLTEANELQVPYQDSCSSVTCTFGKTCVEYLEDVNCKPTSDRKCRKIAECTSILPDLYQSGESKETTDELSSSIEDYISDFDFTIEDQTKTKEPPHLQIQLQDSCLNVECPRDKICKVNEGQASCICYIRCEDSELDPVCGSDGLFYRNRCHLRRSACEMNHRLVAVHESLCHNEHESMKIQDCSTTDCSEGHICIMVNSDPTCVIQSCKQIPACISLGQIINKPGSAALLQDVLQPRGSRNLPNYGGFDRYDVNSYDSMPLDYNFLSQLAARRNVDDACSTHVCHHPQKCVVNNGIAQCSCNYYCETDKHYSLRRICGSDGKVYGTRCELNKKACESGEILIEVAPHYCHIEPDHPETTPWKTMLQNLVRPVTSHSGVDRCSCYTWTRWLNADKTPEDGDFETLQFDSNGEPGTIGKKFFKEICNFPLSVEVRQVSNRQPWHLSEDKPRITPPTTTGGFQCTGKCNDFEIRLLCPATDCPRCAYWSEYIDTHATGVKAHQPCKGNQIPIDLDCVSKDAEYSIYNAHGENIARKLSLTGGCQCKHCDDVFKVKYLCPLQP